MGEAFQPLEYSIKTSADLKAVEEMKKALQQALKNPKADAAALKVELDRVDVALKSSEADAIRYAEALKKAKDAAKTTVEGKGGRGEVAGVVGDLGGNLPIIGSLLSRIGTAGAGALSAVATAGVAAASAVAALSFALKAFSDRENIKAKLLGFGFGAESIAVDIAAVKNLAKALGSDLASATDVYIHAANGHVRALKMIGFHLSENATFTQHLAEIQAQAAKRGAEIQGYALDTITGKQSLWLKKMKEGSAFIAEHTGLVAAYKYILDTINFNPWEKSEGEIEPLVEAVNKSLEDRMALLERMKAASDRAAEAETKFAEAEADSLKVEIERAELAGKLSPEEARARMAEADSDAAAKKLEIAQKAAKEEERIAREVQQADLDEKRRLQQSLAQHPENIKDVDEMKKINKKLQEDASAVAAAEAKQVQLTLEQGTQRGRAGNLRTRRLAAQYDADAAALGEDTVNSFFATPRPRALDVGRESSLRTLEEAMRTRLDNDGSLQRMYEQMLKMEKQTAEWLRNKRTE